MIQLYVGDNIFKYSGIIIAGPAEMKNSIIDHDFVFTIF